MPLTLPEYKTTLQALVLCVKEAQLNALKDFSREKIFMAWNLGKLITGQI